MMYVYQRLHYSQLYRWWNLCLVASELFGFPRAVFEFVEPALWTYSLRPNIKYVRQFPRGTTYSGYVPRATHSNAMPHEEIYLSDILIYAVIAFLIYYFFLKDFHICSRCQSRLPCRRNQCQPNRCCKIRNPNTCWFLCAFY